MCRKVNYNNSVVQIYLTLFFNCFDFYQYFILPSSMPKAAGEKGYNGEDFEAPYQHQG